MANVTREQYQTFQALTRHIDGKLERIFDEYTPAARDRVIECDAFKDLVALGPKIIPYIIHRASTRGWDKTHFMLLNELTAIVFPPGSFYRHIVDWLTWYMISEYYTLDPYFGLME